MVHPRERKRGNRSLEIDVFRIKFLSLRCLWSKAGKEKKGENEAKRRGQSARRLFFNFHWSIFDHSLGEVKHEKEKKTKNDFAKEKKTKNDFVKEKKKDRFV